MRDMKTVGKINEYHDNHKYPIGNIYAFPTIECLIVLLRKIL